MSEDSFLPKRPDYILSARTKQGKQLKGKIGAGWTTEEGRISIHLNPFVCLSFSDDLQITLFPNNGKEE